MARKQLARPTDTHEDFLISALWEGVQTIYELADSSLSWLAGLHRKSSPMEVDASSSQTGDELEALRTVELLAATCGHAEIMASPTFKSRKSVFQEKATN